MVAQAALAGLMVELEFAKLMVKISCWKTAPCCGRLSVQFMDVKLPKLGEGADSGVVVGIFVNVGDTVAKDQAILELENEKAVASIPSTAAGVVEKIHVKAGDRVSIGQKLITLAGGRGSRRRRAETGRQTSGCQSCAGTGTRRSRRSRISGSCRRKCRGSSQSRGRAGGVALAAPDGARTGH